MVQEGDLVLCTVKRIEQTTVFVELSDSKEGTIVTSEIAPGRIRNMREYVVPNKKIVCKVLKVSGNRLELSLRRVNSKEKKEVMDRYNQEKTAKSAIHQILGKDAEKAEQEILTNFQSLFEFLVKAKEDESLIKKYIPKEFQEKIEKITQKKQKEVEVKKLLKLKCLEPDGMSRIKKILSTDSKNIKIIYISAGNFQISVKGENYKEANAKINSFTESIEKLAKENCCEFNVLER